MSLIAPKSHLRGRMLEVRSKIRADVAALAAHAVARRAFPFLESLAAKAGFPPAETPVALYAALRGELECGPLLAALAEKGFPTLLPVAGEKATPLVFRLWRPGDALARGRFGLREPLPEAAEVPPKIVFTPLLGFDCLGTRLGFGGGYYDATLARLREKGLVAAGGLAFACQRAENIPREAHDEKLDFVITEEEILDFTENTCASSSSAT
jgi:5-formyltetrahydrofolate cyclo-ligase